MTDTLNDKEVKRLGELGQAIQGGLSCDINDNGILCRTDRLDAVKHMKEYLEIHGYTVKSNQQPFCNNGMIVDGTHNDPTIISLDEARIVSEFDKDGEPIFNNSILVKELLN
jgi:hypothetical protein